MANALARARKQARAEAAVKYAPQQRVLLDALGTARATERRTVSSARGTTSALTAAIRRARPGLTRGYDQAASTAAAARGDLLGHLTSIGGAAAPFAAAVAREQAGVTSRSAQERANALGELQLRGVQAVEGGASAELNAHRQFGTDATTIYHQLGGIASDKGAFTASQIADITAADKALAETARGHTLTYKAAKARTNTTVRGQNLQHRDRVAARNAKNTNARKNKNRLTPAQSQKFVEHIGSARAWIQRLSALYPNKSSTEIRQLLASGGQIQTGTSQATTATGKTTTHPTYEKVPSFGDPRVVNAAYDLHVFHALSPANQRALRNVALPGPWKRWHHPQGTRVLADVRASQRSGHAR